MARMKNSEYLNIKLCYPIEDIFTNLVKDAKYYKIKENMITYYKYDNNHKLYFECFTIINRNNKVLKSSDIWFPFLINKSFNIKKVDDIVTKLFDSYFKLDNNFIEL